MRRSRMPILQRGCDSCRHDRTKYFYGDFWTPPDVEVGCSVLDDNEKAPNAKKLKKYNQDVLDHIIEYGGCPAWQPWNLCNRHGIPTPPTGDCGKCEEEIAIEESYGTYD